MAGAYIRTRLLRFTIFQTAGLQMRACVQSGEIDCEIILLASVLSLSTTVAANGAASAECWGSARDAANYKTPLITPGLGSEQSISGSCFWARKLISLEMLLGCLLWASQLRFSAYYVCKLARKFGANELIMTLNHPDRAFITHLNVYSLVEGGPTARPHFLASAGQLSSLRCTRRITSLANEPCHWDILILERRRIFAALLVR